MKKLFSLIIVLFCVQFLVTAQEEPTYFKTIEKESNTIFIGLSNKKVWTDQEVRNIYAQYKLDNMKNHAYGITVLQPKSLRKYLRHSVILTTILLLMAAI